MRQWCSWIMVPVMSEIERKNTPAGKTRGVIWYSPDILVFSPAPTENNGCVTVEFTKKSNQSIFFGSDLGRHAYQWSYICARILSLDSTLKCTISVSDEYSASKSEQNLSSFRLANRVVCSRAASISKSQTSSVTGTRTRNRKGLVNTQV